MLRFTIASICLVLVLVIAVPAHALDLSVLQRRAEQLRADSGNDLVYPYQPPVGFQILRDRTQAFSQMGSAAEAKPLTLDGKVIKYLVPYQLPDGRLGGFTQFDPQGRLIALPDLSENGIPSFVVEAADWARIQRAEELDVLAELIPDKTSYSAGIPVDPTALKNAWFVRDGFGRLPGKSQEERAAWIRSRMPAALDGNPLGIHRGRRTGSSKCLSYAASSVADWWNLQLGFTLPPYRNFISGLTEYGWDPRLLEMLYYQHNDGHKVRFWMAPFGKDRVTGEKIPWSIKAYAELLWHTGKVDIVDRLDKNRRWRTAREGFHMDLLPVRIFKGPTKDKGARIKEGLKRFGALLAQHTTRFTDNIPNPVLAAHAVLLVGWFNRDGADWFVYQESFGPNGAGYLEDSVGGPMYRAMPAKLFYQAWGFPHTLRADVHRKGALLSVATKSHEDKPLAVDEVIAVSAGRSIKATRAQDSSWQIPVENLGRTFQLHVRRQHFVPLLLEVSRNGDEFLVRSRDLTAETLQGFHVLDPVLTRK